MWQIYKKFGCLTAVFLFRHLPDSFLRYNVTFYHSFLSSFYHSFLLVLNTYRIFIFSFFQPIYIQYCIKIVVLLVNFSLPGHVNRHSKQLTYETNIFNIFNCFKKFLTIFNSSVDYNFIFSPSFNFLCYLL